MRSRVLFLVLLFQAALPARAATTLNFPRLSFDPATFTGVAIVNPTDSVASVTLTAYGTDGQPLAGIANPVELQVPPEQQISLLTAEIFSGSAPDPEVTAWFQAVSETDGLTGFFLFVNDTISQFDGADLPEASPGIVFNQVRVAPSQSTELNLVNPGSGTVTLQTELINPGSLPISKSLELPAMGSARLDAGAFFGVSETQAGAYVKVLSDKEVAGFEFIRTGSDLLGLNAQPVTQQLTNLYFPQMAVLGPWLTELGLVNYSLQPVIVTFSAYRPDGTLHTGPGISNPLTQSLGAGESLGSDLQALFGFTGTETLEGWLEVEATSAAINGFLSYGLPGQGSIASVSSSSQGQTRAIFSHIATSVGFFTGVAILNSGQVGTNVRILALTQEGEVLGSFNTVLQPRQRISRLIDDLIPGAAGQNGGIIWISSDFPVHLTSLFGNVTGGVLANIPPQQAPESYAPDSALPDILVAPNLSVIQPAGSQSFQFSGVEGSPIWKVNGESGGNAQVGTITPGGLYTAPAQVPDPQTVTVIGEAAGQAAGAAVDILEKQSLLASSGIIQSVVYLGSLERLYTAELTLLGGLSDGSSPASARPLQGSVGTEIFSVAEGLVKTLLARFEEEDISKMISFTAAADGLEYLLLAARTSGRIIRLDPRSGAARDVATGLNQPNALVVDPLTGDLLVAQPDQIVTVPAADLEVGIAAALRGTPRPGSPRFAELFTTDEAAGIAADRCSGDLFISRREAGEILQFVRATGRTRTLLFGLNQPTQLLAVYRSGVGCPESFQLIVIERGANRTLLVLPRRGSASPWVSALDSTDLTFLADRTPFTEDASVLLAELLGGPGPQQNGGSGITSVSVSDLYRPNPPNERPPDLRPLNITTGADLARTSLGDAYSQQLAASGGEPPYTWSLLSAPASSGPQALPGGLSLTPAGLLSGTPVEAGTFEFSIQVRDTRSDTATRAFTLHVAPAVTITTPQMLPGGVTGGLYSVNLEAAGGLPPYSWVPVGSTLPPGLTLSSQGVLSGVPLAAGQFNFTLRVSHRGSSTDSQVFQVTITSLTVTTSSLPSLTYEDDYTVQLSASGGTPPYRWTVISGSLPQGLFLGTDGRFFTGQFGVEECVFADTPFPFTVQVTDAGGRTTVRQLSITVKPGACG